jgi:hypothetical protein
VRNAIEPDESSGEPPLLPLLNKTQEIGSTAGVEFRTKRPVFATMASHIGHVVADTAAWEQSVAFRLEQAAQQGVIRFYARNEGMNLSIPYEFLGVDHPYEPDFLVRLATPEGAPDLTLVLEVKGFEDNQTTAKHEGAQRWVRALNNWGRLGRWGFHVCRNPQVLERELTFLAQNWQSSEPTTVLSNLPVRGVGGKPKDASSGLGVPRQLLFNELDSVALAVPVFVDSAGRKMPAGARGTVVGVWQGGKAYEVEFTVPFACLITVPAKDLTA